MFKKQILVKSFAELSDKLIFKSDESAVSSQQIVQVAVVFSRGFHLNEGEERSMQTCRMSSFICVIGCDKKKCA